MNRFVRFACRFLLATPFLLPLVCAVLPIATAQTASLPPRENNPVAVVPFEFIGNEIGIFVRVGDAKERLRFVLDSGASDCVVDSSVAARLKLRQRDIKVASLLGVPVRLKVKAGGYGSQTVPVKSVDNFNVSFAGTDATNVPTPTLRCNSLPLAQLGTKAAPIDGILGASFLRAYTVEINYETKQLRLFSPQGFVYRGSGKAVPVHFDSRVPSVQAVVTQKGAEPFSAKLILDTGNAGTIHLNRPVTARRKLTASIPTVPVISAGIGGTESGRYGRLESLTLGSYTIPAPLTIFSEATQGDGGASKDRDGGIGNGVWSRFVLTLDFAHNQAFLEPNAHLADIAPSSRYVSGWTTLKDDAAGGYRVLSVIPGAAADNAGLKPGDILTAIDGVPILLGNAFVALENNRVHRLTYKREDVAALADIQPRPL